MVSLVHWNGGSMTKRSQHCIYMTRESGYSKKIILYMAIEML